MSFARSMRHLFSFGSARRHFPARVLDAIQKTIAAIEAKQLEQVVFAVEGALSLPELRRCRTPRQRAQEVFGHLRVWDTQYNSGVLIYVLLADRAIEVVADRGIAAKVEQSAWDGICAQMQQRFAAGEFEQGAMQGVAAVGELLARHFPSDGSARANELPDRPVVL